MRSLKYLITGTGRCGTVYMARLLTSLGIPCGHESFFTAAGPQSTPTISLCSQQEMLDHNRAIPKWVDLNDIVADSSYMAAPFLDDEALQDTKIIHVVRHPLSVVSSFVKDAGYFSEPWPTRDVTRYRWEKFIYGHIPELTKGMGQVARALRYYYHWNHMIAAKLSQRNGWIRHRIEDPIWPVLEFLGKDAGMPHFDNTRVNSWRRSPRFEMKDIPRDVLGLMAGILATYDYPRELEDD